MKPTLTVRGVVPRAIRKPEPQPEPARQGRKKRPPSQLRARALRRERERQEQTAIATSLSEFFFVWSPTEMAPKKRHPTQELAEASAARLKAAFPEKDFLVYRATVIEPSSKGVDADLSLK